MRTSNILLGIMLITIVLVGYLSYEKGYYDALYDYSKSGDVFALSDSFDEVYSCRPHIDDGGIDEIQFFRTGS